MRLLPSILRPSEKITISSIYPVEESAGRISALCMPYTSNSLAFRWLVGTATTTKVQLTWRVRGSKPSGTRFNGTFGSVGSNVVLTGKFSGSPLDLFGVLIWFGAFICLFVWGLYEGLMHANRNALAFAAFAACFLVAALWMARVNKTDEESDVAWVMSLLREALST